MFFRYPIVDNCRENMEPTKHEYNSEKGAACQSKEIELIAGRQAQQRSFNMDGSYNLFGSAESQRIEKIYFQKRTSHPPSSESHD